MQEMVKYGEDEIREEKKAREASESRSGLVENVYR
jgi:hypothetical protein